MSTGTAYASGGSSTRNTLATKDRFSRRSAQQRPAFREVAGEEEDQQDLDRFDGLEGTEVDARIAAGGSAAEEDQGDRERDGAEQRHKTVAAMRRSQSIRLATSMTRQPRGYALRERDEDEGVAQRVAKARPSARSRCRSGCRSSGRKAHGAGEAADTPDEMGEEEGGQDGAGPDDGIARKRRGCELRFAV